MKDENDTVEIMTVDQLGIQMIKGFDELAAMVLNGFMETRQDILDEIVPRLETLEHKVDAFRMDMTTATYDTKKLTGRVENLEVHTFGSAQAA